jgi:hypothetical protein
MVMTWMSRKKRKEVSRPESRFHDRQRRGGAGRTPRPR